MPVPAEYSRAADHFYDFLVEVRDKCLLGSTHQAYTMVQGVFQTFRRRVEIRDAIRFAGILPVGLRALFVTDWDTDQEIRQFEDLETMTKEVQSLRPGHNFSPDTAIQDVAYTMRKYVDKAALDNLLKTFPEGAVQFWQP